MGGRGGNAPNPYRQRKASTLFIRVPTMDWPRVKIGEKTEFRTRPKEGSALHQAYTPTPVVAYTITSGEYDCMVMVLEEYKLEPLFAIAEDAEAIAREGFESYDHFRRYWRARRKGVYRPMEKVWVWRVRRLLDEDKAPLGLLLLNRLYGEYIEP